MSFVGRRVLCEPTTRLTHLPTLCTDPGATSGGGHSGETEDRTQLEPRDRDM